MKTINPADRNSNLKIWFNGNECTVYTEMAHWTSATWVKFRGSYQVEGASTDGPYELLFQHIPNLTCIWTSEILFYVD